MRRLSVVLSSAFLVLAAGRSLGAPPAPLADPAFTFPGSNPSPGSAVSAGLALADRWLGDEPFDNPAIATPRGSMAAPVLLHNSRQDLRARNRNFDEQAAFIDGAGAWIAAPVLGTWLALYAHQPVLRREDDAYERGERGAPVPPAALQSSATLREFRGGLAVARALGRLTLGAAAEWSHRRDDMSFTEESGSPAAGTQRMSLQGDAFGGQGGVRLVLPKMRVGEIALGVGARYLPALSVKGTQVLDLLLGASRVDLSAERQSGWEGGVSVADRVTPQVRLILGGGGRTSREWKGLDVTDGRAWSGSLAMEFHDARDPWTLRLGLGREGEEGSLNPHAGVVALGFGWSLGTTRVDLGALRRSLESHTEPTSFDDRVLVSVTTDF